MNSSPRSPLLILASLAFSLTGIPTASHALDLLGYWDFNDNADPAVAPDVSGNAPGAVLNGPATFSDDAGGFSGAAGDRALNLNGVNDFSYAMVPAGNHLDPAFTSNSMAVSLWQFNTGTGNTSAIWIISPAATGNQRGFQAHTPWSDGTIYFDHAGCCAAPGQRLTSGGQIVVNQWQHLLFQKNSAGDKQIWVDGVMVAGQVGGASPFLEFDGTIVIGAEGVTPFNNSFGGLIDEVAIFGDALSGAEIMALANRTALPTDLAGAPPDTDDDGLPDFWEDAFGLNKNDPGDADDDGDMDGLDNLGEFAAGTEPTDDDTDDDGLLDGVETGGDMWTSASDTGTDPLDPDSDNDGLLDGVENHDLPYVDASQPGTDPNLADTDGDTYNDDVELLLGTDPTDAGSFPQAGEGLNLLAFFEFNDFNDAANTTDSTNGHVGAIVGGAVRSADGGGRTGLNGDYSMDFGPDSAGQYVNVADGSFLNIAGVFDQITVTFWEKLDQVASTSSFWGYSPSSNNGGRGIQAHVPWGDGTIFFDSAGCCTAPTQRLSGMPTQVLDWTVWNHVAFVKNGENKEIWINGILELSSAGADPLPTDFTYMNIGADWNGGGSLQGEIDDFAVFANALTEEEILRLADGESAADLVVPPKPFQFIEVAHDIAGDSINLTWNSRNNRTYALEAAEGLSGWVELDDGIESQGETTSISVPLQAGVPRRHYRVREVQ